MSTQNDLQLIQNVITRLDASPVARLSYTQDAFDNDVIEGVDVFDAAAGQNIPKADKTDYNPAIIDKGVRAQGASIPRMGWNHYIGRLSFNLNKLVQKFLAFFRSYRASLAHNAAEYDSSAAYKTGDVCYTIETAGGVKVYAWYQRKSQTPETISSIPPTATLHWEEVQGNTSSALLPVSAPGYRHKFTVADLTGESYDTAKWYPVTTGLQDFEAKVGQAKEGSPQVLIEAFCNGIISGRNAPHRAELTVLSKFTGFAGSSTDILLNESSVDQESGAVRPAIEHPIGYSKLVKGRQAVIWLRGGSKYALWNSFGSDFELHNAQYANGLDGVIDVFDTRPFNITPGLFKARVKSVEASEEDDAVIRGQIDGAISMPKTLGSGAQLNAVRTPGSYVVTDVVVANTIQQSPVENPGPFELVVRGDKAGLSVTTQQFTVRATGKEFTRVLSGSAVIVPWYMSGAPDGLEISGFGGLFVFDIDEDTGNLVVHYDGDEEPPYEVDTTTGHLIWHAPDDPDRILDIGKVVGAGISGIEVKYQIGSNAVTAPDGEWSAAIPAPQQGKYLWTRISVTVKDGSTSSTVIGYSTSYYAVDGIDGTNGANGADGADGADAPGMSFRIDDDEESPTYGHLLLTLQS
jgi:hypothetical protein